MTSPARPTARTAIVTGASRGIGRAIALQLVDAGWSVEAIGRDSEALQDLARSVQDRPGQLRTSLVDLNDVTAIRAVASAREAASQGVHALVHCAGVLHRGPFASTGVEQLDEQLDVNVRAPWLLTQELLPGLIAGRGFVVFINSQQGLRVGSDALGYAVSKHALRALADGLRTELASSGIRVCTVFPGRTATPLQRKIFELEGREWDPTYLLAPEDVASAVVHVLSSPPRVDVTDVMMRPARKLEALVRER